MQRQRARRRLFLRMRAGFHARQIDLETGAFAGFAVDPDGTAGLLDDAVHRRQPESRAFAGIFGGEEGLEQMAHYLLRHADAGVAHFQLDVAARR